MNNTSTVERCLLLIVQLHHSIKPVPEHRGDLWCDGCADDWPCETYNLASTALMDLRGPS